MRTPLIFFYGRNISYYMLNKAVVNLQTIRDNALAVKRKLKNTTKLNAVVKADGYGHGAPAVANALYTIADAFSVATVEEGVQLRLSGIEKQILVLIPPLVQDFDTAVFYNLTLAIDDVRAVFALSNECERQNRKASVHLKFNSGMNRAGVDTLNELDLLARAVDADKWLYLDGMFSHFARPEHKKSLLSAQNKFSLANILVKGYNNNAICHISASGGFLSGVHGDMVRTGLLLYGYKPFDSDYIDVQPAMKVFAPVIKARNLTAGQTALYGDKKVRKDCPIRLVRYGYADGLPRKQISGQFNNRCMDQTAVLSDKRGGWACVMDDADVLAKRYGTISYEILTKCAIKAHKIYLN